MDGASRRRSRAGHLKGVSRVGLLERISEKAQRMLDLRSYVGAARSLKKPWLYPDHRTAALYSGSLFPARAAEDTIWQHYERGH